MKFASIEIDFDIHKRIEAERKSFDEPPFLALRRLLDLPPMPIKDEDEGAPVAEGRPWREGLVEVPHGSHARMSYQRGQQVFEGKFLNGELVVDGQSFHTLSSAASALAVTKYGDHPSLNGWNYWEAQFPGEGQWRSLGELRKRARAMVKV